MSRTLEVFEAEHKDAMNRLRKLDRDVRTIESGGRLDQVKGDIQGFADFLGEALQEHFRLEEEALFPILGSVIGTESGPIAQMLVEHKELEAAHKTLDSELKSADPNIDTIISSATEIIQVLSAHIHKEDRILFPAARRVLSREQLIEVDRLAGYLEEQDLAV